MAWCEKNVETSRVVNVFGTIRLLERLSERGLSGVYLSSSHVFDGDLPNRSVVTSHLQKINMDSKNAKLKTS